MNGARRARPPRLEAGGVISLRLATSRDEEALRELAELSGRVQPIGPWVVAEVDGALLAALPLTGGEPLGDPFRPTAELGALLALRAKQLGGGGRSPRTTRRSLRRRLGFTFRRRSRPPVLTS